jgi:multidrug efflux pump subunit AcrB
LIFWTGLMGEFMKYLPITLVVTLSSSLFVALVINPALCAVFMKVKASRAGDTQSEAGTDATRRRGKAGGHPRAHPADLCRHPARGAEP